MDRRKFLQCSIQAVAGASLIVPSATAIAKDSTNVVARVSSFARLDAISQAQLVAKGEVTPSELLEDAIRRIETLNPKINAVVLSLFDQARTAARGPLPDGPFKGVPYAIKDEFDLKGTRRTAGSRLLANNISTETSPIVARSIAAGFLVLGKTNMPEFGLNATTEIDLFRCLSQPMEPGALKWRLLRWDSSSRSFRNAADRKCGRWWWIDPDPGLVLRRIWL